MFCNKDEVIKNIFDEEICKELDLVIPRNELRKLQEFKAEYPNRNRILQESISLIQTTNNINTLKFRYHDAFAQSMWCIYKKREGMPITLSFDLQSFQDDLNRATNFHLVRIANFYLEKYKADISDLKSSKAIDSRTTNTFNTIIECKQFLQQSKNRGEAYDELTEIYNKVEDIYSSL